MPILVGYLYTYLAICLHIRKVSIAERAATECRFRYTWIDGKIYARPADHALIHLIVHILIGRALFQVMFVFINIRMRLITFLLKLSGTGLFG